jgi:hypothetical protein
MTTRKSWFIDRVGKVIYRNRTSCTCAVCEAVYTEGLFLDDALQADYCYETEAISNYEGDPLLYFDTIEDRNAFEAIMADANLPTLAVAEGLERCVDGLMARFSTTDAIGIQHFKKIVSNYLKLKV